MTTSRIYAYRWPARLVSHKPFAAESYSITPSCIWQVFFRKKNEFSFLFSPFCQRAHFLCKMHNPQAFLPVENSAVSAVQCLVWTVLPLLYIYNKRQGRSTTVLALSVQACRLCQLSQREGANPLRLTPFARFLFCRYATKEGSREELLRPWPAGCKARSRAVAAAGCHNSSRAKRRQFQIVTSSAVPPAHPGA